MGNDLGDKLITQLGYTVDSSGLEQAQQNLVNYRAQAVMVETELKNAKLSLLTEYSAANRAANQEQLDDLRTSIQQQTGALAQLSGAKKQAALDDLNAIKEQFSAAQQYQSNYQAQIASVQQLTAQHLQLAQAAKEAGAAVQIFNQQQGGSPLIQQIRDLVGSLSQLVPGLAPLESLLSKISVVGSLPFLGTVKAGGSLFEGGAAAAGGVAAAATEGSTVAEGAAGGGGAGEAALGGLEGAGAGATAAILGTVGALVALGAAATANVVKFMDQAQAISNMSSATGLTNTQVQAYSEMAKEAGLDSDQLTRSIGTLQAQLGRYVEMGTTAGNSSAQFVKVLTDLGVSVETSGGKLRPINDILSDFADKLEALPDPEERAALATDALGARGRILLQMFDDAVNKGESFRAKLEEISNSKIILSDEQSHALLIFKGRVDDAWLSLKGFMEQLLAVTATGTTNVVIDVKTIFEGGFDTLAAAVGKGQKDILGAGEAAFESEYNKQAAEQDAFLKREMATAQAQHPGGEVVPVPPPGTVVVSPGIDTARKALVDQANQDALKELDVQTRITEAHRQINDLLSARPALEQAVTAAAAARGGSAKGTPEESALIESLKEEKQIRAELDSATEQQSRKAEEAAQRQAEAVSRIGEAWQTAKEKMAAISANNAEIMQGLQQPPAAPPYMPPGASPATIAELPESQLPLGILAEEHPPSTTPPVPVTPAPTTPSAVTPQAAPVVPGQISQFAIPITIEPPLQPPQPAPSPTPSQPVVVPAPTAGGLPVQPPTIPVAPTVAAPTIIVSPPSAPSAPQQQPTQPPISPAPPSVQLTDDNIAALKPERPQGEGVRTVALTSEDIAALKPQQLPETPASPTPAAPSQPIIIPESPVSEALPAAAPSSPAAITQTVVVPLTAAPEQAPPVSPPLQGQVVTVQLTDENITALKPLPPPVPASPTVSPLVGAPIPGGSETPGQPPPALTQELINKFATWTPTGPPPETVPGMVQPGNIDLTTRPLVENLDNSISSLLSMSYGTDKGETLVPKVSPQGTIMSDEQAQAFAEKTGQTLGTFVSVDAADAYAQMIHEMQGAFQVYANQGQYNAPVHTRETTPGVYTPVEQLPPYAPQEEAKIPGVPTAEVVAPPQTEAQVPPLTIAPVEGVEAAAEEIGKIKPPEFPPIDVSLVGVDAAVSSLAKIKIPETISSDVEVRGADAAASELAAVKLPPTIPSEVVVSGADQAVAEIGKVKAAISSIPQAAAPALPPPVQAPPPPPVQAPPLPLAAEPPSAVAPSYPSREVMLPGVPTSYQATLPPPLPAPIAPIEAIRSSMGGTPIPSLPPPPTALMEKYATDLREVADLTANVVSKTGDVAAQAAQAKSIIDQMPELWQKMSDAQVKTYQQTQAMLDQINTAVEGAPAKKPQTYYEQIETAKPLEGVVAPDLGPVAQQASDYAESVSNIDVMARTSVISFQNQYNQLNAIKATIEAQMVSMREGLSTADQTTDSYKEQLGQLSAMQTVLDNINTSMSAASKNFGLGQFLTQLDQFGKIISEFAPAMNKQLTQGFAGVATIQAALENIGKAGLQAATIKTQQAALPVAGVSGVSSEGQPFTTSEIPGTSTAPVQPGFIASLAAMFSPASKLPSIPIPTPPATTETVPVQTAPSDLADAFSQSLSVTTIKAALDPGSLQALGSIINMPTTQMVQGMQEQVGSPITEFLGKVGASTNAPGPTQGIQGAASGALSIAEIGGSIGSGISAALNGPGGVSGAFAGMASMASMGATAAAGIGKMAGDLSSAIPVVGGLIGGVVGLISGLFGAGKAVAQAQQTAKDIGDAVEAIKDALEEGAVTIPQAMSELQQQYQQASQISGKGTESTKIQLQQQLTQEMDQLQVQQQQILQKFALSLGELQVPQGAQQAAQAINQITTALQQAAQAGASAAQQADYFNAAVGALALQLGQGLQQDEQSMLGMLQQDIQLRQQQQDIITNAANQELSIMQNLGVVRNLTPAQQAAQQIALIEQNKAEQLASLNQQQQMLEAQINGQAELFGWSLADLNNANAKQQVLAAQLALQTQITAETVAGIQAQQQFYQSLLQGQIPTLPSGILSTTLSGTQVTAPAGSQYVFNGPITIQTTAGSNDPATLAQQISTALQQININQFQGQQS